MVLFSLFRKARPEVVCQSIARKIMLASLVYRKDFIKDSHKAAADAGAEVAYFLLHVLDVQMFDPLGAKAHDAVFDQVAQQVIADYAKAVLRSETPNSEIVRLAVQMLETLNARQLVYSKCPSFMGNGFPSVGLRVFALAFFVHRALGRTVRTDGIAYSRVHESYEIRIFETFLM
jgi:hypothetical protein